MTDIFDEAVEKLKEHVGQLVCPLEKARLGEIVNVVETEYESAVENPDAESVQKYLDNNPEEWDSVAIPEDVRLTLYRARLLPSTQIDDYSFGEMLNTLVREALVR